MVGDDALASGNEQEAAAKVNSSAKGKESHPPAKKYRMTEQIKSAVGLRMNES
jgi:hypothetical protein